MALFDEKASTYDDFCNTPLGHFIDIVEHQMIAAMAKPKPEEAALDLGCGTGSYTYWLHDMGLSAVGVDVSRNMLEVARHKRKNSLIFLQADLVQLPFNNDSFDLAVCNAVLEFTDDPVTVLKEGFRVVKPGGRLVVGAINKYGPWGKKYVKRGQQDPTSVYRHAQFFSFEDITRIGPQKPSSVQFGLYTGPDNFQDFDTAIQLERHLEGQPQKAAYHEAENHETGYHEAGYLVVRWDKRG